MARDDAGERAARIRALAEAYADPGTRRRVEALGIAEGWRCLEAGCGGGSIARWLRDRVGLRGRVLAIDIDTRLAREAAGPNLEVKEQDLVTTPPPEGAFDFVHARFVLHQLPQREAVLKGLVAALAPGGWLLLEEQEMFPLQESGPVALRRTWGVLVGLMRARGMDMAWARRMPGLLQGLGLAEVGAEVETPLVPGGSPAAELWSLTLEQMRPQMVGTGLLPAAEADAASTALRDAGAWFYGPATVAAWARRPAG